MNNTLTNDELISRIAFLKAENERHRTLLDSLNPLYLKSDEANDAEYAYGRNLEELEELEQDWRLRQYALDEAHKREGDELETLFGQRYQHIQDQEAAAAATLDDASKQRAALHEVMAEQMAAHPERLAVLVQEYGIVNDDVTRLVEAALAYRRELARVEDLWKFIDEHGLDGRLLTADPFNMPPQGLDEGSTTLEEWLLAYRSEKLHA